MRAFVVALALALAPTLVSAQAYKRPTEYVCEEMHRQLQRWSEVEMRRRFAMWNDPFTGKSGESCEIVAHRGPAGRAFDNLFAQIQERLEGEGWKSSAPHSRDGRQSSNFGFVDPRGVLCSFAFQAIADPQIKINCVQQAP
ncbi:MAG: hypothetical protein FJX47_03155 [Alphaproteobacteria bacterium]|nr:hypothetical protein [Alphaproteobacteria bacterium]